MLTVNELAYCFTLQPHQIIRYLNNKGYKITWDWEEMWQHAHARAFTVAKVMKLDILEDIRSTLEKAIKDGQTAQWFKKELTPILKAKGWWGKKEHIDTQTGEISNSHLGSAWRLDTIFRTNMATLYSAGRFSAQRENVQQRPYWMYCAIRDNRTRQSHLALHGKVFLASDPFWQSFYPPNGWRCRCSVIALTEQDVKARGLALIQSGNGITQSMQMVSKKTGELRQVTHFTIPGSNIVITPDIGWDYNPGMGYRPDLARFQGSLGALARRELKP